MNIWNVIGAEGAITLQRGEVDAVAPMLSRAIATAKHDLRPAGEEGIGRVVRVISGLPSADSDSMTAAAMMELYAMALDDIPSDILEAGVRAAVRDTEPSKQRPRPSFRPSPNELRAYCVPALEERRRRLKRLEEMAKRVAEREQAARSLPAPTLTDADIERIKREAQEESERARAFGSVAADVVDEVKSQRRAA